MKLSGRVLTVAISTLALVACGDSAETGATGERAEEAATVEPSVAPEPFATPTPLPDEIPAALQGRWGLVPADCTSTAGDAKGLLTIGADKLEFYESVGTLGAVMEADPTRMRGTFSFTGEGMNWNREIVLDVQDDGQTLIRREYGTDAAPGPFRYTKCA